MTTALIIILGIPVSGFIIFCLARMVSKAVAKSWFEEKDKYK